MRFFLTHFCWIVWRLNSPVSQKSLSHFFTTYLKRLTFKRPCINEMHTWKELGRSTGIMSANCAVGFQWMLPVFNVCAFSLFLMYNYQYSFLGQVRSVVVDGVTVGHPCCMVHNCTEPLRSTRNKFCQVHWNQESICAVVGCSEPVSPGFQTCINTEH